MLHPVQNMKESQSNEASDHQLLLAVTSDKAAPNILTLIDQ